MTVITARIIVAEDGIISGRTPVGQVPPGEHDAAIILETTAPRPLKGTPFTMEGLKVHDVAWDDSISLRCKDLYDDGGPLR